MQGEAQIKELRQWFESGDAQALMRAYQNEAHYRNGTIPDPRKEPRAAVQNDDGLLRPEYFSRYMTKLHDWVFNAQGPSVATYRFLQKTLQHMIGSLNFGDQVEAESGRSLKELFEKGRRMGKVMEQYMSHFDHLPGSLPQREGKRGRE